LANQFFCLDEKISDKNFILGIKLLVELAYFARRNVDLYWINNTFYKVSDGVEI
jgi:hypothetical protein